MRVDLVWVMLPLRFLMSTGDFTQDRSGGGLETEL